MRAVAVALLASRVAAADDPLDLPMADATLDVGSDLTIVPLAHSVAQPERDRVVFDTHGNLFVIEATPTTLLDGSDVAANVARSLADEPARVAKAHIEPFALRSRRTAYAVVPTTPARANELIYAAYVPHGRGSIDRLGFYAEDDSTARDLSWRVIADRIARTTRPAGFETVELGPWTVDLPRGWARASYGSFQMFGVGSIHCFVSPDPPPTPDSVRPVASTPGNVLGQAVTWQTYTRKGVLWTTTVAGATYVGCAGIDPNDVAFARYLLATLAPKP